MKELGIKGAMSQRMGADPARHGGHHGPHRICQRDVQFEIRGAPEGQDMVKGHRVEIGILRDVDGIIPQHKLMAVHLPKDRERCADQEQHNNMGSMRCRAIFITKRSSGGALMSPGSGCAISHHGFLYKGFYITAPTREAPSSACLGSCALIDQPSHP